MENIDELKKCLAEDINAMKHGSIGEMILIIKYSLISYMKSLLSFGYKSNITKDNLLVIKEMFNILRLENKMLDYILKNIKSFDFNSTIKVVMMLDELNEKTIRYYYDVIDDIEIAADMNNEFRGLRPSIFLPTLIVTPIYAIEVIALGENFESLKTFLGFEDDFWNYIKDKVEFVDNELNDEETVEPIIENGIVKKIKVRVPKITDLQTALLTLDAYKKAYDLYKMLGCNYDENKVEDSSFLQKKYQDEYLLKKVQRIFPKQKGLAN